MYQITVLKNACEQTVDNRRLLQSVYTFTRQNMYDDTNLKQIKNYTSPSLMCRQLYVKHAFNVTDLTPKRNFKNLLSTFFELIRI